MTYGIKYKNDIYLFEAIPKSFKNVINAYDTLGWSRHYADGFREYVPPYFNPATQELGDIYFDETTDVFTHPIIDLTPLQQQQLAVSNALKSIDDAYEIHEVKGKEYSKHFQRFLAGEYLVFGNLTETEAKNVGSFLKDVFFILNEGQWKNALDVINLLSANVVQQPYLEKIRLEVETYINEHYTQ
jgi:hypothetical protein